MNIRQQPSVFTSLNRVLTHNKGRNYGFYLGILLRTLDRSLDMLPLLLFFAWFWQVAMAEQSPLIDVLPSLFNIELESTEWLTRVVVVLLGVFLLQLFLAFWGQRLSFISSYQIMRAYRQHLINVVRRLPLGRVQQFRTGEIADVLTQDVKRIESIFTHVAADLAAAVIAPLFMLSLLIYLEVTLAFGLMCTLVVAVIILVKTRQLLASASQTKHKVSSEVSGYLVEFTSGLTTLLLFNRASVWLTKLHHQFNRLREVSIAVEKWGAAPVVSFRFIVEMSLVAGLVLVSTDAAASLQQESSQSILTLLMFFMLTMKMLEPLLEASEYSVLLRIAVQSENKVNQLLRIGSTEAVTALSSPKHFGIAFKNVSFSYGETPTLELINFEAMENQVTAIVGPSGAGKSSILSLLARFHQPNSGVISIGDRDIQQLNDEALYACLSCVFQQAYLFDGSILDNVRIGNPAASDEQVMQACRDAYCEEFIARLPQGYQSKIGEGGMKLSGGERQRLSIARGILNPAPILLLDEVTAAVDPSSQFYIQQSLQGLTKNKTVIMVAHRLSQVVHADKIVVVDQGSIVEQGEHSTLLDNKALYYRLWLAQKP